MTNSSPKASARTATKKTAAKAEDATLPPEHGDVKTLDETGADIMQPDRRRKAVLSVPIEVIVSVGKARPLLNDLVSLRRDSVLALDTKIEDPVEILIGDRVIARGELQEIDGDFGRLGVRLTEVADLSQSL